MNRHEGGAREGCDPRRRPGRLPLSPAAAVLLAISFGLCGGYLDLGVILFKKLWLNPEGSFRCARDFPWTVPVSQMVLLAIPGGLVAAVNRLRPKSLSLNVASWLFATLAIWSALLRSIFVALTAGSMALGNRGVLLYAAVLLVLGVRHPARLK